MGGRSVKALRRRGIRRVLEEEEIPRGARRSDGSKPLIGDRRACRREQSLGAGLLGAGAIFGSQAPWRKRQEGSGRGEPDTALRFVGPLEGKSCTRLWDGTSPRSTWWRKPSRAGGTPRTERSEELGAPCSVWTPRAPVAKRNLATPRGALLELVGPSGPGGS